MKISVIIPLYNKKDTVIKAVKSVLDQTCPPYEIIIINDGSTDGSDGLVSELKIPFLKLFDQKNSGVAAARSLGIDKSEGDWIAFLDADDEWLPEYLETILTLSENYPQCLVLATSYYFEDHKEARTNPILRKIPFKGKDGILNNYFEVAACSDPPLWTSAVTVKKTAIEEIGGFPAGIESGEDLLTWARLAAGNQIAYSLRTLSVFRQDAAHTYHTKPNRIPRIPDIVGNELISLAGSNAAIPGIKDYVAQWMKMRASVFLRLGMRRNSFKEAIRSLYMNPFQVKVYIYILMLIMPMETIGKIFRRFGNR